MLLDGLQVSLIITFFSFTFATLLGFGICGLKMSKNSILKAIGSIYVTVLRGTPIVVLLMITFYIIFARSAISGTWVAVIAFGANGAAFIGEIIRSAILTIDKGQVEAARSMGFSKVGAFFTVTLPQAVRVAFPVYMSEFISLFKMTSVVGYIAIVDLTKAGDIIRSRTYDAFFPLILVALIYLLTATLLIYILNLINRKTNKRMRRAK
jgi:polar amino acid transport system substrate-binding protein